MKHLNEFLNEGLGKMGKVTLELQHQFQKEVKTNEFDWALNSIMPNRVMTKFDGTKFKEPGSFKIRIENTDDRETVDKKRQVQTNFWEWLVMQPGVKKIGGVSGEFKEYEEAVEYKGYIFIKRKITDKHTITHYISKGRFKNSGMWNQNKNK